MYKGSEGNLVLKLTPDGIAGAAATLTIYSQQLQDTKDLIGTFWDFFNCLARDQEQERRRITSARLLREVEDQLYTLRTGVVNLIFRRLGDGALQEPFDTLTNDYLLSIDGLGPSALAEIRRVFPNPEEK